MSIEANFQKENEGLTLSEMFQTERINFGKAEDRNQLKKKIENVLLQIVQLYFQDLQISPDGYVTLSIDVEEKCNIMGELGYCTRVGLNCTGLKIGEATEKVINEVISTLNIEIKRWKKAKKKYKEKFKGSRLRGRTKAYAYKDIYKEIPNANY